MQQKQQQQQKVGMGKGAVTKICIGTKLSAYFLVLAILGSSLLGCHGAVFSLVDPVDMQQQLAAAEGGHPRMPIGWEEMLKIPRSYGVPDEAVIMVDKMPNKFHATGKAMAAKRGDEKRRDFEHGWEQCEVVFANFLHVEAKTALKTNSTLINPVAINNKPSFFTTFLD